MIYRLSKVFELHLIGDGKLWKVFEYSEWYNINSRKIEEAVVFKID